MSDNYFHDMSNATAHSGDIILDPAIVSALPPDAFIIAARGHGVSKWNITGYVEFQKRNELPQKWFLKLTAGDIGLAMVYGEFQSMTEICKVTPEFAPRPISWGSCSESDQHFFLCEFHDLVTGLPLITDFVRQVAKLHQESRSPTGKFGFHVETYNGTLEQYTKWTETWEEFYKLGTIQMLLLEQAARGPNEELIRLSEDLLTKVIPRLLRPLETNGRRVKPSLLHGDLWIGNVATRKATGRSMIFDSAAYYGHHEYELSTLRPMNDDWSRACIEKYHKHIPRDDPVEDWDARNALYALRTYIIDSALYPEQEKYQRLLIQEMRKLVEQFPEGYVEG